MNLITIKEAKNASELVVLKSKLESEGIQCFIKDELSSQVLNYIQHITAKLQIEEKDLKRALKIISENDQESRSILACPKCNSTEIKIINSTRNFGIILSASISAIFSFNKFPIFYEKTDLICKSCSYRFKL